MSPTVSCTKAGLSPTQIAITSLLPLIRWIISCSRGCHESLLLDLKFLIGFPDEHFCTCAGVGRQVPRTGPCETNRIAGMKRTGPFELSTPLGNEEMHIWCIGNLSRLHRLESSTPAQGSLLLDGDRCIMTPPRGNGNPSPSLQFSSYIQLLITRCDAFRIRRDPHLDEMHVFVCLRVHLRVPDPCPGTHALGKSRVEDAGIALRVLMLQFTVEHPGHNLHIVMGMGAESRIGFHHVIVAHQKQSMMGVVRIVVV